MTKRAIVFAFLSVVTCLPLAAQNRESLFSLSLTPTASMPIMEADAEVFGLGFGGELAARYRMPFFHALTVGGVVGYEYGTLTQSPTISTVSAAAEIGLSVSPFTWLAARVFGRGGYFYSFLNGGGEGGGNGVIAGGAGLSLLLTPSLGFDVDCTYRSFLGFSDSLTGSVGITYHFAPPVSIEEQLRMIPKPLSGVKLDNVSFGDVFPVLFKYYDTHPIGTARLTNGESSPIEDLKVTVFVQQYMANPKACSAPARLAPGERASVDLYGLFTDTVLRITESTKVSTQIVVEGIMDGKSFHNEYTETLRLFDRNALSWDDDRKAAAFVTLKDPTSQKFAKNVSAVVKDLMPSSLNKNLLTAMAVHQALSLYGLSYQVDPSSAYSDFSKKKNAVDYLQFPRQTLEYKAGDCDDLSILNCALLESLGIPTAFITVPGHIFMAFALGMSPEEAAKQFATPSSFIFKDNETWVPVEITSTREGFLQAWDTGAREWAEGTLAGTAGFYPLKDAWSLYEPVGFSSDETVLKTPGDQDTAAAFLQQMASFISREVQPREAKLLSDIKSRPDSQDLMNKLGVLYARYGMNDKAEDAFRKTLTKGDYVPALINLANILFITNRVGEAVEIYQKAVKKDPKSSAALLGLVLASTRLEKYAQAGEYYSLLKKNRPDVAERFAYLGDAADGTARAGQADMNGAVQWEQ